MKKIQDFFNRLENNDAIPMELRKKLEWLSYFILISLVVMSFLFGGELMVCLLPVLPMTRSIKVACYSKKPFAARWIEGFIQFMKYFAIEIPIIILSNYAPTWLQDILYFKMEIIKF